MPPSPTFSLSRSAGMVYRLPENCWNDTPPRFCLIQPPASSTYNNNTNTLTTVKYRHSASLTATEVALGEPQTQHCYVHYQITREFTHNVQPPPELFSWQDSVRETSLSVAEGRTVRKMERWICLSEHVLLAPITNTFENNVTSRERFLSFKMMWRCPTNYCSLSVQLSNCNLKNKFKDFQFQELSREHLWF